MGCSPVDEGPEVANSREGGPDRLPNPAVYLVEFETGTTFSDGFDRVLLSSSGGATLEGVEILGGNNYFDLVGIKVAGPDRRIGSIQFDEEYPPQRPGLGKLVDGDGAVLEPGPVGSLLLVGMKVVGEGPGSRTGLRVTYSYEGTRYYQDHPSAVVNCPPGTSRAICDRTYATAFADAQNIVRD